MFGYLRAAITCSLSSAILDDASQVLFARLSVNDIPVRGSCQLNHISDARTQVIVLTHELSDPNHFDTYLVDALKPARPLLFFGRSTKATPGCKPDECVWYWWKETVASARVSWKFK